MNTDIVINRVFECIYREAEQSADSDKEDCEKNKDGQSIAYQNQAKESNIRSYGCYLFSLIKGAHKNPRLADIKYNDYIKKGYMDKECLIQNPAGILKDLTGHNYNGERVDNANGFDPKADIAIAKWSNGSHEHFVLMKDAKTVLFDSLGHSNTVGSGKIVGWRLFYDTQKGK